jgi:hypothetical protein
MGLESGNDIANQQRREAAKARKKQRKDDADARIKSNKENALATSIFKAALKQGATKKRVIKLVPNDKLIFNAVENNKRRH